MDVFLILCIIILFFIFKPKKKKVKKNEYNEVVKHLNKTVTFYDNDKRTNQE
jgi:preprotein translocase subunit YajC